MPETMTNPVGIAQMGGGGRNIINPMRKRHREDILQTVAYIYNITPYSWAPIYRTHGVTIVVGNEAIERVPDELLGKTYDFGETDGIKWSRILVRGRIELVEAGIESSHGITYREESTEADEIAADITNTCNADRPPTESGTPCFGGVFWSADPKPTVKQLKEAQKKLFTYYRDLVEEGDKIWAEKDTNVGVKVETMMKVAFKTLKAHGKLSGEKPWVFDPTPAPATDACPVCGAQVPPAALRCKSCLAFLSTDKEQLRKYFPNEFAAEVKTPPTAKEK